jgi:hypothetical protein
VFTNRVKSIGSAIKNLPSAVTSLMILAFWSFFQQGNRDYGITLQKIQESVVFTADGYAALTTSIPAGSRVVGVSMRYDTAVVLSTAVKIGVGTEANPDAFALSSTDVVINTKTRAFVGDDASRFTAATPVRLTACDTDGAAAGTVTSGTVTVIILLETIDELPDYA